jgi:biopolymer transport protein ExbB
MNLLEMFFKGGIMMYPILLCSVIAVYVVIERILVLQRAQLDVGQFLMKLRSIFQRGDVAAVVTFCSQKDAPIANIIHKGILKHEQGDTRVREAIEETGRAEVYRLEKHLSWLATISGVAPMLGFLGTVTGMVRAFQRIETLGGVVTASDLGAGIWEALITTVFGLLVGIPALAAYNYFVTRVTRFVHEMEVTTSEFLDLMERRSEDIPVIASVEHHRAPGALVLDDDQFFRKKL